MYISMCGSVDIKPYEKKLKQGKATGNTKNLQKANQLQVEGTEYIELLLTELKYYDTWQKMGQLRESFPMLWAH